MHKYVTHSQQSSCCTLSICFKVRRCLSMQPSQNKLGNGERWAHKPVSRTFASYSNQRCTLFQGYKCGDGVHIMRVLPWNNIGLGVSAHRGFEDEGFLNCLVRWCSNPLPSFHCQKNFSYSSAGCCLASLSLSYSGTTHPCLLPTTTTFQTHSHALALTYLPSLFLLMGK